MDGFLGIATLRDWDVRLDVPGRTMTLFPAGKADGPEGETSVPLILIPHDDSEGNNPTKLRPGTFLTRASINGKAIPLLVDTGFDASLDLPAALAEKAVPGICAREQKSVETLTASGLGQSRTGHFPTVRFGPDTFASLAGIISTRPAGSRGNDRGKLGLEVLRHYVMTFRFEEGRLGLKPVGTPWKPDPGSTRGFTFTPDFKIFGIRRGGPAGKAGLKKGDRVLAINGHDPRSMTMEAISAFDELPPGTTLRIRYSRNGGEPKEVAVILEKE